MCTCVCTCVRVCGRGSSKPTSSAQTAKLLMSSPPTWRKQRSDAELSECGNSFQGGRPRVQRERLRLRVTGNTVTRNVVCRRRPWDVTVFTHPHEGPSDKQDASMSRF